MNIFSEPLPSLDDLIKLEKDDFVLYMSLMCSSSDNQKKKQVEDKYPQIFKK